MRNRMKHPKAGTPSTEIDDLKKQLARVQSENELFRAVIEGTTDAIFVKDLRGCYLHINEAGARFVDQTPDQILGKDDYSLFERETAKAIIEQDEEVLKSGEMRTYEEPCLMKDGTTATFLSNKGPCRDRNGKVIGLMGISRDISDRKAREVAEKSNQQKASYLAQLSHEIRTPLTAITGYAECLSSNELKHEFSKQAVRSIIRNSRQILSLLDDVLDFSKIEAGKIQVEKRDCSPQKIINEVMNMMRGYALSSNVDFRAEFDTQSSRWVVSDPVKIRQILLNLVSNAIKFSDGGSVRVRLHTKRIDTNQELVEFSVVDTGIGIAAAQMKNLFEPYTQVSSATHRKFGGSGLGLAISKKLASRLGGELTVESHVGKGSTFVLSLKCRLAKNADKEEDISHVQTPHADSLRGTRILVAEDDEDNSRLFQHLLEASGSIVQVAKNGAEAFELVNGKKQPNQYDVVLMDMHMPIMNGCEATKAMRKAGFNRPIIAFTASPSNEDKKHCFESGCNGFLAKPIGAEALVDSIRKQLA